MEIRCSEDGRIEFNRDSVDFPVIVSVLWRLVVLK